MQYMLKRFENLIVFDLIKIHEEGKGLKTGKN
jgi:hypothetical protein